MSNIILIKLISNLFYIYNLLIFARIMSSWFEFNRNNSLYKYLYYLTEPVLGQFRDLLRSFGFLSSGIDFSPMIAIITLNYLKFFIIRILLNL